MTGLAFHEDLALSVLLSEAEWLRDMIQQKASAILPGVTVELLGGFRRLVVVAHDNIFRFLNPTLL